jgi:hypothetical protein
MILILALFLCLFALFFALVIDIAARLIVLAGCMAVRRSTADVIALFFIAGLILLTSTL